MDAPAASVFPREHRRVDAAGGSAAARGQPRYAPDLPSPEASVVNTTGAGDAAMSAIVWADMRGLSLEDSARAAQLAGAITCANEAANAPELSRLPDLLGAK